MATAVQIVERENYLNSNYGIKSWLLTTDHKRIAVLYLISITAMFWLGGFFAMMIRLELLTPAGDRSEEHTSELQSLRHLVCRLLLEKKMNDLTTAHTASLGPAAALPVDVAGRP